jgi:Domain of unknown function (DUF6249)
MNELTIAGLEWIGALTLFLGFILFVRYLDHRERMSMIEHGLVPEEAGHAPPRVALLRGGLITTMVGFAVTVGLYTLGYLLPPPFNAVPGRLGPWLLPGLIPLAVGLALVASYYLAPPRNTAPRDSAARTREQQETPRRGLRILDRVHDPHSSAESGDGHDAAI